MPRLGNTYDIEIEVTSKPKADYSTDEYFALDLPVAPAIMVGDEIYIYYGGYSGGHKVDRFNERHIGFAKILKDRYVSRDAEHDQYCSLE